MGSQLIGKNCPKYTTRIKGDQYTIRVSISGRFFKFDSLTEQEKIAFFHREAMKNPLKAMACVHKYARRKDFLAQQIAALYAGYQTFLGNHDRASFQQISHPDIVRYLDTIFSKKSSKETELSVCIDTLLPGFAESLTMPPVEFVHEPERVHVPEIQGSYNAFPDLVRYQDVYYLSFREAGKHQGKHDRGSVRILKGRYDKGWRWENEALLESDTYDLRDPKFFVDGKGHLNLMIGGSIIDKKGTQAMRPHVATFREGKWTLGEVKVDPELEKQWIWQVAWHDKAGYGFAYGPNKYKSLHFMKTGEGCVFEKVSEITAPFNLTESTVHFKADGSAIALIRADPKTLIAGSHSPYHTWTIEALPFHGGGQNFIFWKKGFLVTSRHLFLTASNRVHERQLVAYMDGKELIPMQILKSHMDTGYAGIVLEEDKTITMAYYSADRDETSSIYIVKIASG